MRGVESLRRYIDGALHSLESPLKRLVFLASLRDAYTGHYLHEGWVSVSSPEEVNQLLQSAHLTAFEAVLKLALIGVCKELREHFSSLARLERETAELWLEVEPFHDMIPQGCSAIARQLFVSQIRRALEVLVHAPDWPELAEPAASQPPQPAQPLQPRWLN